MTSATTYAGEMTTDEQGEWETGTSLIMKETREGRWSDGKKKYTEHFYIETRDTDRGWR